MSSPGGNSQHELSHHNRAPARGVLRRAIGQRKSEYLPRRAQDLRTALHIIERLDADLRQAGTLVHGAVDAAAQPASAAIAGEAQAWMHENDPTRVISAQQKTQAERDGGAYASSLRPYTIPLSRDAAPQASSAPVAFSKDGVLFWYGDHAARRGFNGDLYLAPLASEAVGVADIPASLAQLVAAVKGMTKLYPHVWDRTDGGLVVFPENVARFDAAFDALRIAVGEAVDDDETAALSSQPGPQTEAPHDDQWTPEQLAAIESQGPAEPFEIPLVPITYPVPDEIADPCPQCVSGAVCKKPTCGRLIAQTSGQADVTLPPAPRDVAYAVRRIRSCDDEAAAQVALERFANGHARAAILASRQQRARLQMISFKSSFAPPTHCLHLRNARPGLPATSTS